MRAPVKAGASPIPPAPAGARAKVGSPPRASTPPRATPPWGAALRQAHSGVILRKAPECKRSSPSGKWHYFKISAVWKWFEEEIYKKYGDMLRASAIQADDMRKVVVDSHGGLEAMMASDARREVVATRTVKGLKDVLDHVSTIEVRQKGFPIKFKGGGKTFSTNLTVRDYGHELYVQTQPSNYKSVVKKIKDEVGGTPEEQARTIRRLLKGKKLDGGGVVKDVHLERTAAIFGFSETVRNPASFAHLMVVLHLVKKGEMSWDDVTDSDEKRYIPSLEGEAVSRQLQELRVAMLDKFTKGTKLPKDLKTLTAPYRNNLGAFLVSASAAYDFEIKLSNKHPGEIMVTGDDADDAWVNVWSILRNKILKKLD